MGDTTTGSEISESPARRVFIAGSAGPPPGAALQNNFSPTRSGQISLEAPTLS
jgi:hypothetical protein